MGLETTRESRGIDRGPGAPPIAFSILLDCAQRRSQKKYGNCGLLFGDETQK